MKKALLVVAGIAGFGLIVAHTLRAEAAWECEACIHFGGRHACGTVAAPDRLQAADRAVSHACGILTTGVTQSLACERTAPSSLTCRER